MVERNKQSRQTIPVILLVLVGVLFVGLAFLYNEFLLSILYPKKLTDVQVEMIRWTQLIFVVVGLVSLLKAYLIRKVSFLNRLMQKPWVEKLMLAALAILVPLVVLELSLRPIVHKLEKTTIFMKDDARGWVLRPDAIDVWGGVEVRVNGKGVLGPELTYEKEDGVFRILYLGDSVTFGMSMSRYEYTFPDVSRVVLERRNGIKVEAINAGVPGYSTWQANSYLVAEGTKYNPDLIVLGYCLNDITEPFFLTQFGGTGEGMHVNAIASSFLEKLVRESSLVQWISRVGARIRFGKDVQAAAAREENQAVETLIEWPDSSRFAEGWKKAFNDLEQLYKFAGERNIPVVLAIFPWTSQFADLEKFGGPQEKLTQHAREHGVPVVDFLPVFSKMMKDNGTTPEKYFIDADHFSEEGCRVVGETIADFVESHKLIRH